MTDAVKRLTKLADDYASRGDFATEDDIRTLLAAYADAARDRERATERQRESLAQAINTLMGQPFQRLAQAFDVAPYAEHASAMDNSRRVASAVLALRSTSLDVTEAVEALQFARSSLVGCFLACARCGEESDCSDMDAVMFIDRALSALTAARTGEAR